ncbi:MAG: hypothetical protein ACREDJ_03935, partial [Methylocella sp.]
MSNVTPRQQMAWGLCAWVDGGASGSPPPPWTAVFVPAAPNPNFAVILQDSSNPLQYALVIQGTKNKGDDALDWDIDVPVSFPAVSGAYIAQGVFDGLENVIGLTNTNGVTLLQHLQSINWSTG